MNFSEYEFCWTRKMRPTLVQVHLAHELKIVRKGSHVKISLPFICALCGQKSLLFTSLLKAIVNIEMLSKMSKTFEDDQLL